MTMNMRKEKKIKMNSPGVLLLWACAALPRASAEGSACSLQYTMLDSPLLSPGMNLPISCFTTDLLSPFTF